MAIDPLFKGRLYSESTFDNCVNYRFNGQFLNNIILKKFSSLFDLFNL